MVSASHTFRCVGYVPILATTVLFLLLFHVDKPIRCWNNECVTTIEDCTTPYRCPSSLPYRCITGECVEVGLLVIEYV